MKAYDGETPIRRWRGAKRNGLLGSAMRRSVRASFAIAGLALAGCTTLETSPVSTKEPITFTCIRFNPDNNVDDLVSVIQSRFQYHGIQTMLIRDANLPPQCQYVLEYTADRWWDLAPYMVDAKLTLTKSGVMVGSGHYHLNGHGGLSLDKWAGTASKLDPVIDAMLQNTSSAIRAPLVPTPIRNTELNSAYQASTPGITTPQEDVYTQLTKLDDLRKKGIITDAEFDTQKKKILEAIK
jgi:putative oligomerization/nucleic acid binding protein